MPTTTTLFSYPQLILLSISKLHPTLAEVKSRRKTKKAGDSLKTLIKTV
jgi:hypothetical protein